jgi:hypothetical protein
MTAIRILFVALLFFLAGCGQRFAPGFVVLDGAEGTRTFYVRGIDKMIYRIHREFPAQKAIEDLSSRVEKLGFKPLDKQFLYPDLPTAHVQGWTYYEQSKKMAGFMVYEWTCDWKDANNNILTYTLEYRDPIQKYSHGTYIMKPGNDALVVNGVFMPEKTAIALRESLHKSK